MSRDRSRAHRKTWLRFAWREWFGQRRTGEEGWDSAGEGDRDSRYNWTWLRYAWEKWLKGYQGGGPVLDLASGVGVNGQCLRRLGASHVVGLDLDWGCARHSRRRGLSAAIGDLCSALPFRPGSADIVLLIHALEHFENGLRLLEGIRPALRPGGAIVIVTPNWRARTTVQRFFDDYTHRRPYTAESLRGVLTAAGFKLRVLLRHNVGYGLGRTPLWRWFPRLCFTGDALFAIAERED